MGAGGEEGAVEDGVVAFLYRLSVLVVMLVVMLVLRCWCCC